MMHLPENLPISILKSTTKFQVGMVVKDARRTAKEYEKFGVGHYCLGGFSWGGRYSLWQTS